MFQAGHRWFRFSLRTLIVAIALMPMIVSLPLYPIQRRRLERIWIEQHGGTVDVFVRPLPIVDLDSGLYYQSYQRLMGPEIEPEIPKWRRWLGDEAYNQINLPAGSSGADLERTKRLFPEARVDITPHVTPGGGFF
jgi:hypothetical protein